MKVITTPRELLDKGVWDKSCDMTGINPYALNEGLMEDTERIEIEEEQAIQLGLIKDDSLTHY